ncbi:MAG TPA: molybdopterin-synthase adenylyltransferase MoeB [Gemmatimonadales bacterium]|nr:molybdopterin-synthase adenylyltransferase MoeB [Gemmatimonadales bacterium]
MTVLSRDELLRYSRHLVLPGLGLAGQEKLKQARVLVVGAGGLGSPAALYLAAAGVGTIVLADPDRVDATNLQRQILHSADAVGRPKVESARERLADLNPHVQVEAIPERLTSANAREVVRGVDVVLDGSDNFPTRYLMNDACVLEGKPLVYGSIFRFDGQVSLFGPGGPCYRCLFADPPPAGLVPNCAEGGVVGALPGIIGSLQALEAIKHIVGAGESLLGRLLLFDGLQMTFREVRLRKDPECPVCGEHPTVRELIDYEAFCGIAAPDDRAEISPREAAAALAGATPPLVLDVREPWEWDVAHIDGSLHIPLGQLPARLREVDTRREVVTLCHHGMRSLAARELLLGAGFSRVKSLAGGIDQWAEEIDTAVARY